MLDFDSLLSQLLQLPLGPVTNLVFTVVCFFVWLIVSMRVQRSSSHPTPETPKVVNPLDECSDVVRTLYRKLSSWDAPHVTVHEPHAYFHEPHAYFSTECVALDLYPDALGGSYKLVLAPYEDEADSKIRLIVKTSNNSSTTWPISIDHLTPLERKVLLDRAEELIYQKQVTGQRNFDSLVLSYPCSSSTSH